MKTKLYEDFASAVSKVKPHAGVSVTGPSDPDDAAMWLVGRELRADYTSETHHQYSIEGEVSSVHFSHSEYPRVVTHPIYVIVLKGRSEVIDLTPKALRELAQSRKTSFDITYHLARGGDIPSTVEVKVK